MNREQILTLFYERKKARAPVMDRARQILDHYEGRVDVVLPEVDKNEKVAVANLINQGIDQHGMRIASTIADVEFPPLKPGRKSSEDKARKRRAAVLGWWEDNEMEVLMHQRARWLIAYASAPVLIRPGDGIPKWELRSPLNTYPAPMNGYGKMTPHDCIFAYSRTVDWVRRMYPEYSQRISAMYAPNQAGMRPVDQKMLVLEYVDDKQYTMLLTGSCDESRSEYYQDLPTYKMGEGRKWVIPLWDVPNRTELCPVVVPGRIGLEESLGQFDGMIGLFEMQAKMMAVEYNAVYNAVWPEAWLVARQNEVAEVITAADGPRGIIGEVKGGDIVYKGVQPGFQTYPTIDRLERSQRLAGGIPAEFGGESPSNIRTGRRGQDVLSAIVDFPILEAQKLFARSQKHENVRAIATMKAYFGNQPKSFFVSWRGAKGFVDYVANDIFETDAHDVRYAHPGADANGLVIGGGQRVGLGTLSKEGFMRMDPMVEDPEREYARVIYEGLESSVLVEIQQPGSMPVADKARVGQLVVENNAKLFDAVLQAQKEAQERQSQVDAVAPGSPEAQPGLSPPGAGAEAGVETGPPDDLQGMTQMLGALRLGQRASGPETAANVGANVG